MPPKASCPAAVIADFRRWIAMGAPDPRDWQGRREATAAQAGKHGDWWSLAPLEPTGGARRRVRDGRLGRTPIDAFVLAKLAEQGLRAGRPRPTAAP